MSVQRGATAGGEETERILTCGRMVTPHRLMASAWIAWRGETITRIGCGVPPAEPDWEAPGCTVVPGFIDTHVHGGGGGSFDDGADSAREASAYHRRRGTTTLVASLVSDQVSGLERRICELGGLVTSGELAGIHLEGPWLSHEHRGAHVDEALSSPMHDDVDRLLGAGTGVLATVTLAPELPGGLDAVRRVTEAGVRAAVGHTAATYDQTVAAVHAGVSIGTHVFNAMRPIHHREPGPAVALMERPEVFAEVVADGRHVHPAMIRQLAANPARLVLVSDAISAAGQPDGMYALGGLDVELRDGRPLIAGSCTLAGSTLTLSEAVRFCVGPVGLDLQQAVAAATATPAALLGRDDVGVLEAGRRADLVLVDAELHVGGVLVGGRWEPGMEPDPAVTVNTGLGAASGGMHGAIPARTEGN
ncbi:N-acetylglucosamine-6-phosphate deacetylase [Tomitella gaofuii]|uniref:N-acetylglucosamine-6-phosphate deacetylase n=1 Tax=Tomitella gaofuii TaxID=2760083 RepID=UPI0015FB8CFD|nr:N-acetylglucosamine-6-phosphate deacetylase [Tomitella gaofuii]